MSIGPIAWATVQHGFTRGPAAMSGVAELLFGEGIASVRPALASLRPWASLHDRDHLRAAALARHSRAVARWTDLPWIGVGHSAGAAAVLVEAATRLEAGLGVAGVICLDGTDTVGGIAASVLAELAGVPVRCVGAAPSRCNAGGRLADLLAATVPDTLVVQIAGAGHGDAERIGRLGPAPAVYRVACGDGSGPDQVRALAEQVTRWARELTRGLRPPHVSQ